MYMYNIVHLFADLWVSLILLVPVVEPRLVFGVDPALVNLVDSIVFPHSTFLGVGRFEIA
jgi:hypothetical protein